MKKEMIADIVNEIENFGECFIGTVEVQGLVVFKRFEKVRKAYEKANEGYTLAYDSKTGMAWEVR